MPRIHIEREHGRDRSAAIDAVRRLVDDVRTQFSSIIHDVTWKPDGSSADVKGKMFTGTFGVTDAKVVVDVNLSMLATPFQPKVEARIQNKLNEIFG